MSSMFTSLRLFNYRVWFIGALVANIGTWMQRVAQDWLVLAVLPEGSAVHVGIVTGLQFLPVIFLSPLAGLIADRVDRRKMLITTQAGMGLLALALGLLVLLGTATVYHVYFFALALGVFSAFDAPVRQVFVSDIVPASSLANAVALNSASFNAARLVGPGLAGVLISLFGGGAVATGWVILLNAASYAAPIISLRRLDTALLDTPEPSSSRGLVALREGLAYVRRRPDLLMVLAIVFSVGTFGLNFQLTSALMATEVFDRGATEYGLLGSFLAVGALAGALFAARRAVFSLRLVVAAAIVFGLVEIVAGLAPSYATFALLCPVLGLASLTLITSANGYMQMNTGAGVRGRVMALYLMVFMGGTPVGAPVIGWIGEVFGARWTLLLGGVLTVLGVAVAAGLYHITRTSRTPVLTLARASE